MLPHKMIMTFRENRPTHLVGGWPTPLKNMTSSVRVMPFPTVWEVIKTMFQTTNQSCLPTMEMELQ
jgi:hypothetical protein